MTAGSSTASPPTFSPSRATAKWCGSRATTPTMLRAGASAGGGAAPLPTGALSSEITQQVPALIGEVPASSVRSYLQLNTPQLFARMDRAQYMLNGFSFQTAVTSHKTQVRSCRIGKATLFHDDCLSWLERQQFNSVHAVVTDQPYGLIEYSELEQRKLRAG